MIPGIVQDLSQTPFSLQEESLDQQVPVKTNLLVNHRLLTNIIEGHVKVKCILTKQKNTDPGHSLNLDGSIQSPSHKPYMATMPITQYN